MQTSISIPQFITPLPFYRSRGLYTGRAQVEPRDPEWPSGLVARSPSRRSGFDSGSVGLSEINFSDLYCGWLGRHINVEYNTIQYNTIHYNTTGVRWCKPPRKDPGQVLHSQLLMRLGVKVRFSVRAVVGSASEWESGRGAITSVQIQYIALQYKTIIKLQSEL